LPVQMVPVSLHARGVLGFAMYLTVPFVVPPIYRHAHRNRTGATFSCREYHLGVAVSSKNTKLHCPHASLAGGGVCVKPKAERYKEFCATYLEKCDKSKSGGTYADCAKFVAAAALGVSGATGGDSFSCRE
jgi:hypothetical protein